MQAKRTPPSDAEVSAAETLAQRREQNRLAQKRFRERAKEAKKQKAKELAEQQERQSATAAVAAAAASPASSTSTLPIPRTHSKAVQSLETFAWLANTMGGSPRSGNEVIDPTTGLTPMQTNMAMAMCGPNALDEYVRYAKLMPLPPREYRRDSLSRQIEQQQRNAEAHLSSASAARVVAPLPAYAQQQRASSSAQVAQPIASSSQLFEEPSWMQPNMYNAASSLQGGSNATAAADSSAFATQDWQAILNQPLMGVGAVFTSSAQPQQAAPTSSRTWMSDTITPSTSTSSFFTEALPTLDDLLPGGGVGSGPSTTTTSVSSSTAADSPEVIETIGISNTAREAKRQVKLQQYADSLEAVKTFRRLNPTKAGGSTTQPGLPNRHDPNREQPLWVFPPAEVLNNHRLPDGRLTGTMTREWMHSSPYVGLLTWVLQLKAMSPRQFDDWLKPGVVRLENFVFPQSDFMRALYGTAQNTLRIGREQIDDMEAISDIAASWSLSESSRREPRRITAGDASSDSSSSSPAEREWHTQRWRQVPKNLWPTKLQCEIKHHPWIDCGFPWASVRDSILTLLEADVIDEDELCADIIVAGQYDGNEPAFRIWGSDSSDPMAWEVSEEFAQKWHAILNEDIIQRTNWWRKQRGLHPIQIVFGPSILAD